MKILVSLICWYSITNQIDFQLHFTVIIDGPDSVNAVDGTTVQFSCVVGFSGVAGTMEIDFFVNNTATNQPNIEAGFTESTVKFLNATTLKLNLTTIASSQYNNNTTILCRGLKSVGIMTFPVFSEEAVLLVQGKHLLLPYF